MKTKSLLLSYVFLLFFTFFGSSYAQFSSNEETIGYINERLAHSVVLRVDTKGEVKIKTPDRFVIFNLKDALFNYNGSPGDHRLQIVCDDCLKYYGKKSYINSESRQLFQCESEKAAYEVVNAFKHLKKQFAPDSPVSKSLESKIPKHESGAQYSNINEAIDFINERLAVSIISKVDDNGVMTINAPSLSFKVKLKEAEFNYVNSLGDHKVRIYGDFCITSYSKNESNELLSRQAFGTTSKNKAFDIIKALYFIKYIYLGQDVTQIKSLRNVSGTKNQNYTNVAEAIDYINDRLSFSIIMDINKNGDVSINSLDNIFRFNINDVEITKAVSPHGSYNILKNLFFSGSRDEIVGVKISCPYCIKKYSDGKIDETLEEQDFSCNGESRSKEVIKAFRFIKSTLKK